MKKTKDFPVEFTSEVSKKVGIIVSKGAIDILWAVPSKEKGTRKHLKRLIRIRKNVFREIEALNKELQRHSIKGLDVI